MVKNIATLFSVIALLCSCSSDDNNSNPEPGSDSVPVTGSDPVPVTAPVKYVNKIIYVQDGETTTTQIVYDDAMKITAYASDATTLRFIYENDRVVAIKNENAIDPYALQYTNGILSGLNNFSIYYTVNYNANDRSYTFEGGNYYSFGLTGKDILYTDTQGYRENFTYDTTKKGPFYSLKAQDIYPLTLFGYVYYYTSAAAITSINITGTEANKMYTAENTYDDAGYITSAILRADGVETFRVQYEYIEK